MLKDKKLAFLLGSGISIPAGLPSTTEITSRVLSGENVIRHTDSTYYFQEDDPDGFLAFDVSVQRITSLLKRIELEIDHYFLFEINHQTNYEDLYYVASQVFDSELREYENPIVGAFIEKISNDLQKIQVRYSRQEEPWDVIKLFRESINYIRDVVWRMLLKEPEQISHLQSICDACSDVEISQVDIFTLNHDTLLEKAFEKRKITFNTGFGSEINNVSYWHPKWLLDDKTRVRLIKLHGSINWFRFSPNEYSYGTETVGIPGDWDIWHTTDPSGERQTPLGGRPVFLAGTFNKMLHYTSEIFADLHIIFRQSLSEYSKLIICGYSFGDKGINSQIVEWMSHSNENCIVVIHKNPRNLKRYARGAITKNWDNWKSQNRLSFVEEYIESITWAKLKNVIF